MDKNVNSFDIETIKECSYTGLRGKLLLANY